MLKSWPLDASMAHFSSQRIVQQITPVDACAVLSPVRALQIFVAVNNSMLQAMTLMMTVFYKPSFFAVAADRLHLLQLHPVVAVDRSAV